MVHLEPCDTGIQHLGLAQAIQVDDVRAMHPHEPIAVEVCFEVVDGAAQRVVAAAHAQVLVVVAGLQPLDAAGIDQERLVTMKFLVNSRGAVKDIEIADSHPPGLFDAYATTALRRWRFEPPMRDGRPTEATACQTFTFNTIVCPDPRADRVIEPGDPCLKLQGSSGR